MQVRSDAFLHILIQFRHFGYPLQRESTNCFAWGPKSCSRRFTEASLKRTDRRLSFVVEDRESPSAISAPRTTFPSPKNALQLEK